MGAVRPSAKTLVALSAVLFACLAKVTVHQLTRNADDALVSVDVNDLRGMKKAFLRGGFAVPVKPVSGSVFAGLDNGVNKLPGVNVEAWAGTKNMGAVAYPSPRRNAHRQPSVRHTVVMHSVPQPMAASQASVVKSSGSDPITQAEMREQNAEAGLQEQAALNAKLQAEVKAAKAEYAAEKPQESVQGGDTQSKLQAAEELNAKLRAEVKAVEAEQEGESRPKPNPYGVLARSPTESNPLGVLARSPSEPSSVNGVLSSTPALPDNVDGVLSSKALGSQSGSARGILDRVSSGHGNSFLEAEGSLALLKGNQADTDGSLAAVRDDGMSGGSLAAVRDDGMSDGVLNHVKTANSEKAALSLVKAGETLSSIDGSLSSVGGNDMADGVLNHVGSNSMAGGVLSQVQADPMEDGILKHVKSEPRQSGEEHGEVVLGSLASVKNDPRAEMEDGSLSTFRGRAQQLSSGRRSREIVDGSLSTFGKSSGGIGLLGKVSGGDSAGSLAATPEDALSVEGSLARVHGSGAAAGVLAAAHGGNPNGDLAQVAGSDSGGVLATMERERREWVREEVRLHELELQRQRAAGAKQQSPQNERASAKASPAAAGASAESQRLRRLRARVAGLRERALGAGASRAQEVRRWEKEVRELHVLEARRLAEIRAAQARRWRVERLALEARALRDEVRAAAAIGSKKAGAGKAPAAAKASGVAAAHASPAAARRRTPHHPVLHQHLAAKAKPHVAAKAAVHPVFWPRRTVQTAESAGAFRQLEDAAAPDAAGGEPAASAVATAAPGGGAADYGDIGWVKQRWTAVGWSLFAVFGPVSTAAVTGLVAWCAGPVAAACTFIIMGAMDVASYYYSWYTL